MKNRVLIIGLDGASLDLLTPWIEQGLLPGFARLFREGASGKLESVPNMRSAAAWTTFMTGKNPGKHGIFEFYDLVPGTYDIRFINARTRDSNTFWKIASDASREVGIINVPMTYPAEKVNGFQIAGLDAPGVRSKGFTHPPDILERIEPETGRYVIEPGITGRIVEGDIEAAKRILFEELDVKVRTTRHLMNAYPSWDLFVTVFRSTDAAHHCFWKYMDSTHPQHDPAEAALHGDVILRAYQKVDAFLEETLPTLDPDTTVILMSDHGCGQKHPASNQINQWLAARGYLTYKSDKEASSGRVVRALAGVYKQVLGRTPRPVKEALWRLLPTLRDRVQTRLCFSGIDWSRTRAYSDSLFPIVQLNVQGREPKGIVRPGEDAKRLTEQLCTELADLRDRASGEPIVDRVMRREEIYQGPYQAKAPDLLIRWREDIPIRGIRVDTDDGADASGEAISTPFIPGEDYRVISGDHQVYGVFCARGKGVRPDHRVEGARLMDIAPTALHALGLPIPTDMDGTVIEDAFEPSFLAAHPVRMQAPGERQGPGGTPGDGYTAEEEDEVRERMRGLGYVE